MIPLGVLVPGFDPDHRFGSNWVLQWNEFKISRSASIFVFDILQMPIFLEIKKNYMHVTLPYIYIRILHYHI